MLTLAAVTWPPERAAAAAESLCLRAGLTPPGTAFPPAPEGLVAGLDTWLETSLEQLHLEVEPVEAAYPEVETLLRGAGPALFSIDVDGETRLVCLLRRRGRRLCLLGPDLRAHRVPLSDVKRALCRPLEEPLDDDLSRVLDAAGLKRGRRRLAREALLSEWLADVAVGGVGMLRLAPGAATLRQARRDGLVRRLGALLTWQLLQASLFIVSWWIIGRGALAGRLNESWLIGWTLVVATMVPVQLLAMWTEAKLSVGIGTLLKRRLLQGALRLTPEEVRHEGAGIQLGKVYESQALEHLVIGGGVAALASAVDLVLALFLLGAGAGGGWHVLLLVAWAGLAVMLGLRLLLHVRRWTESRLGLAHDLVERMVGQRTRLAQMPRARWHEGEDEALARATDQARVMDGQTILLRAFIPQGWVLVGLLGLLPFVLGAGASTARVAVAIGGVLFAAQALSRLTLTLDQLAGAAVAWRQIARLFRAAGRTTRGDPAAAFLAARASQGGERGEKIVEARELVYRHERRLEDVVRRVDLEIRSGDRILLEGPSGSGKSTLASLLVGLRAPRSGLLLYRGLDRATVGPRAWRRRIVGVPQLHENYVFSGTFAFNLLLGRDWPARPGDLARAQAVCRGLGLDGVLARMPAGLNQTIGENGWQLSHGERGRLFLARALLQEPDVVVLDESFAALDPDTLEQTMRYSLESSGALLVIAHP